MRRRKMVFPVSQAHASSCHTLLRPLRFDCDPYTAALLTSLMMYGSPRCRALMQEEVFQKSASSSIVCTRTDYGTTSSLKCCPALVAMDTSSSEPFQSSPTI